MTLKHIREKAAAEGMTPRDFLINLRESRVFGISQANAYLAQLDEEDGPPSMKKGEAVEVDGIWLKRDGDYVIVCVERNGRWVEVIREHKDGPFSHIVEPNGIRARTPDIGSLDDIKGEFERQKSIGWGRGMFIAGAAAGITPKNKTPASTQTDYLAKTPRGHRTVVDGEDADGDPIVRREPIW